MIGDVPFTISAMAVSKKISAVVGGEVPHVPNFTVRAESSPLGWLLRTQCAPVFVGFSVALCLCRFANASRGADAN